MYLVIRSSVVVGLIMSCSVQLYLELFVATAHTVVVDALVKSILECAVILMV